MYEVWGKQTLDYRHVFYLILRTLGYEYLFYVHWCFAMGVGSPGTGVKDSCDCRVILGIEPRSSERAASALNH